MSGNPGGTSASRPKVYCVLSEEQQEEYAQEIAGMRLPGIDFVFQSSPDRALDEVAEVNPSLVFVGMEIGPMEGLEFLAMLMNRHKDFDRRVIVLPNKGDPFPPMMQFRDPKTGRSSTDETDLSAIGDLVRSIAAGDAAPVAAPTPAVAPGDAALAPGAVTPSPPASQPLAPGLMPEVGLAPPASRPKWPFVVGAVVVVAVAAVVVIVLSGDGGEPGPAPGTVGAVGTGTAVPAGTATPAVTTGPGEPLPETASGGGPGPGAEQPGTAGPAGEEAAGTGGDTATAARDLTRPVTLPLRFARGSIRYAVRDEDELDAVVTAARDILRRDPGARLEVGGHTSSEGSSEFNDTLGQGRADAVLEYLVGSGLPRDRMLVRNYGSSSPAASDDTAEGRELNRRVTIRIVD